MRARAHVCVCISPIFSAWNQRVRTLTVGTGGTAFALFRVRASGGFAVNEVTPRLAAVPAALAEIASSEHRTAWHQPLHLRTVLKPAPWRRRGTDGGWGFTHRGWRWRYGSSQGDHEGDRRRRRHENTPHLEARVSITACPGSLYLRLPEKPKICECSPGCVPI